MNIFKFFISTLVIFFFFNVIANAEKIVYLDMDKIMQLSKAGKVAIEKNIPTITKFFNSQLSKDLVNNGKSADLIIGNNVFAHVPCLNDFVDGLKILLNTNGVITLEFPHLLQLMQHNQFDTIYHEHFSYFSVLTAQKIFDNHDLKIFDVDEISTHGGSLRLYITHKENNSIPIFFLTSRNE